MSLEPLPEDTSESHLGFCEQMDGEAVEEGPASGVSDEDDWVGAAGGIPLSDPLAECSSAPSVDRFIQECAISASAHPALSIELPWESQPFRTIFWRSSAVLRPTCPLMSMLCVALQMQSLPSLPRHASLMP